MTKARSTLPSIGSGTEFRRILVPTDLTERTQKALHLALTLATPGVTRVILLHVIETIPGLASRELGPFYRRLERQAQTKMTALVRRASHKNVEVTQKLGSGARAETIVGFADAHEIDLIVLASHKVQSVGGWSRLGNHQLQGGDPCSMSCTAGEVGREKKCRSPGGE